MAQHWKIHNNEKMVNKKNTLMAFVFFLQVWCQVCVTPSDEFSEICGCPSPKTDQFPSESYQLKLERSHERYNDSISSTLAFPNLSTVNIFWNSNTKKTRDFKIEKRNRDFELLLACPNLRESTKIEPFKNAEDPSVSQQKTTWKNVSLLPSIAQFTSTLPKAKRFGMLRRDTKSSSYFTAAKGGSNMIIIPIAVSRFVFPTFKACKTTRT